ncbi:MAG TPA: hypothetical protein VFX35_12480 [Solirubrobacterales bacterium]|nr:hypothetical protein [Solirubrobacterales bacterium]
MIGGWQGIANMALTAGLLAPVVGFFALCGAISHGDHPLVLALGKATAFLALFAAAFGTLLGLAAIWS